MSGLFTPRPSRRLQNMGMGTIRSAPSSCNCCAPLLGQKSAHGPRQPVVRRPFHPQHDVAKPGMVTAQGHGRIELQRRFAAEWTAVGGSSCRRRTLPAQRRQAFQAVPIRARHCVQSPGSPLVGEISLVAYGTARRKQQPAAENDQTRDAASQVVQPLKHGSIIRHRWTEIQLPLNRAVPILAGRNLGTTHVQ